MRVAIVGNVALDIVYKTPRLPADHEKLTAEAMVVDGGGAPANVAFWLARLGHEVRFFSVTGTDPLSGFALASLAQAGVDISGVRRIAGAGPAISSIFVHGARKCMIGGGPDRTEPRWQALVEGLNLSGFDHVHLLARLHPLLFAGGRRADFRTATTSTDLNGAYRPDLLADLDFCFTNADELAAGGGVGDIEPRLAAELGAVDYHFVVTQAAEAVTCYRPGKIVRTVPQPVAPIDRTGGGDAFCAAYLHATWAGAPPDAAIAAGLCLARAVLSGYGSRPLTEATHAALQQLMP